MVLRYRILGDLIVERGEEQANITSKKQRALLAVLLVHVGNPVTPDGLIDAVWGEEQPGERKRTLRFHVSQLRDALEPDRARRSEGIIETTPAGYRLVADRDSVDAFALLGSLDDAERLLGANPAGALEILDEQLADLEPPLQEFSYEEFAIPLIREIEERVAIAQELRVDALMAVGERGRAISLLQGLTKRYPYREALATRLILGLYQTGRQVEALRVYDQMRNRFAEELGVEPGQEMEAAVQRVLEHDPSLVKTTIPGGRHNLPAEPAELIDRVDEVNRLDRAFASSRLVAIAGLPGIGKSRLARSWARTRLDRFSDGVVYVDAARLPKDASLADEFAAVFSRHAGRQTDAANAPYAAGGLDLLIVLDGADERPELERLVDVLLANGGSKVLVTARSVVVPSGATLGLGPLDDAAASAFVDQHLAIHGIRGPEGAHGGEMIRAAAGIPLLLQLAVTTAQLASTEPAAISQITTDRLSAIVAEVVATLDAEAALAAASLSTFVAPFMMSDAARVLPPDQVVDLLSKLTTTGIVVTTSSGLQMSGGVRFGLQSHVEIPPAARGGHAAAVLGWEPQRLGQSTADVEAALEYLAENAPERAVELLNRASSSVWSSGQHGLLAAWQGAVLANEELVASPALEGALYFAANCARSLGATADARAYVARHRSTAEQLGGVAMIYSRLLDADLAWFEGDSAVAKASYADAAELGSRLGHSEMITGMFGEGIVSAYTGDIEGTVVAADRIVAAIGEPEAAWGRALAAELLGLAAQSNNDPETAARYYHIARESPRATDRIVANRRLIEAHLAAGDLTAAREAWLTADAELAGAPIAPDPGFEFAAAMLAHSEGEVERARHAVERGSRSLLARPSAVWMASALAVGSATTEDESRRARAQALAARHSAATGIILPAPYAQPTGASDGPAPSIRELALALGLRASATP